MIEVQNLTKRYENKAAVSNVTFNVRKGEVLGFLGPNGAGKTTLLKLLLGELEATQGKARLGNKVDCARFAQNLTEVLDEQQTVFQEFKLSIGDQGERNLRTVLGGFGFRGEQVDQKVGDLSGGERTRLALAITMANPVNLLVLDEPTNHLDLPSCDRLEDALNAYPGTLVLVTHDRHLIRGVADALIVVRNGTARWHEGVDENLLRPASTATEPAHVPFASTNKHNEAREDRRNEARRRNKMHEATKNLRDELREVEHAWEKAEEELAELQNMLSDSATYDDPERARALGTRHEQLKDEASHLMDAYETVQRRLARREAEFQ